MKYILNVINILVYINSASNNILNPSDRVAQLVERRSSNSKVAGSRPSRGRQHLSACAGYGNYIIHTLEHFHLNILRSVQLHNLHNTCRTSIVRC